MTISSAPGQVLSTMDEAGRRIRLRPRPAHGRFWWWRGVVAYGLIALFVALPFLTIGGRPALLIDLASRELVVAGSVFRPSDGAVLMLLGLTIVLAVFLVTALWGRIWCGWGCPQTVYLEWVFRPLERLIEGGVAGQRRLDARGGLAPRRILTYAVFAVLAVLVANVFLAYFVGVERLRGWVVASPLEHPGGFGVMAVVGALMFLDFAWFREQTCILACPYGRLQSVLLDRQSMIVGYDAGRGELRGKAGKARTALPVLGDCVDCRACVATCPTGIDIRDGLQMECIGCAQCVDACDAIMARLGRPRGLIRYSSDEELGGAPRRLLRVRTVVYPALLAVALGLLIWQLHARPTAEVWALRVEGAPFSTLADGRISSQLRLRIENRSGATRRYTVEVADAADVELAAPRGAREVTAGDTAVVPVVALSPAARFVAGERPVTLRVRDDAGFVTEVRHTLIGPAGRGDAP
jgi:cytochrome c oxidase accessory protein FixG